MKPRRWQAIFALAALLAGVPAARAQQPTPHIGYVYPAGGRQSATFEAVIGGQLLTGVNNVYVTGGGVQAAITELIQPITGRELNDLRIRMDELLARKAVVRNDFRALEQFRSFKNAKSVKSDSAANDKQLEELKKKYANATWTAADDTLLYETRRKLGMANRRPANPAISQLAVVQVTMTADAAPGQRELRIATPFGLSNPLVFYVSQLPEFSKPATKTITQQKSAIAKTAFVPGKRKTEAEMSVTLPAIVNGQILPGEVDRYRFTASKGQRLVITAAARDLIPYIADAVPGWFQATLALYDARGKELAYDDDYRFNPDPVLYYQIPADGQYVVEIKDAIYRGREDFVYRITIGELPFVTSIFPLGGRAGTQTIVQLTGWNLPLTRLAVDDQARGPGVYPLSVRNADCVSNAVPFAVDTLPECLEQEPNNDRSCAQRVTLPVIVNGRIDQPDDCDVFCFEGRGGSQIVAEVSARRLGSPLDSVLELTDARGKQLAFNDDHEDQSMGLITHHADSYLCATLPTDGTYYLHLGDMQHNGGPEYAYRLRISPPRPDFELRVVPSSITVRGVKTVPITVYALRKDGFSGEIALAAKGPPEGVVLAGGLVPANQDRLRLTLTVPSMPPGEPFSLPLEGRAMIQGRQVTHPAVPAEDMMQAFEYRHLVPVKELKVAVAGRTKFKMDMSVLGKTPLRIPAGGTARVQVASRFVNRIEFELSEPPEGITIKDVSSSAEGAEIVLESDAAKVKPGLKGNLIVTVSAKKTAASGKEKAKTNQRRSMPFATLPAIPFEVIGP